MIPSYRSEPIPALKTLTKQEQVSVAEVYMAHFLKRIGQLKSILAYDRAINKSEMAPRYRAEFKWWTDELSSIGQLDAPLFNKVPFLALPILLGDVKSVTYALEKGASANVRYSSPRSLSLGSLLFSNTSIASEAEKVESLKLLQAGGMDLTVHNFQGRPLVMLAVEGKYQLLMLKQLLELGANPNAICDQGFTPLHRVFFGSAGSSAKEYMEVLMNAGADQSIKAWVSDGQGGQEEVTVLEFAESILRSLHQKSTPTSALTLEVMKDCVSLLKADLEKKELAALLAAQKNALTDGTEHSAPEDAFIKNAIRL